MSTRPSATASSATGDVEATRTTYARQAGRRELRPDEYRELRAALDADERRLRSDLAAIPAPLEHMDPAVIREGWDLMTLDERREVIDLYVEAVVIAPAKPGTRKFDSDRVTIHWREA